MIQPCPSCGARFALADDAFTNGPRKVRCAKCKHVWRTGLNGIVDAAVVAAVVTPVATTEGAVAQSAAVTQPSAKVKPVAPVFTKPPLPSATLLQNMENVAGKLPRLPRRLAWSVVALMIVLMLAALFFGRYKLAARFPLLEQTYTSMGLIMPPVVESFDLQLAHAEKCLVSGRNMLCLSGKVTNKAGLALAVPTIYITALNKDGQEFTDAEGHTILTWKIPAESEKLLAKDVRNFSLVEPYPDVTVTDFDYGFIDDEQ